MVTQLLTGILCFLFALIFAINQFAPSWALGSAILESSQKVTSLKTTQKNTYEVFGFAPYWTLGKMENVDFGVLTTLAYFGVGVNPDGTLDENSPGYNKFYSDASTQLFQKAHQNGTRVVLTVTQMDDDTISTFLQDKQAQKRAVDAIVAAVKSRGIDGVNVDFEYVGTTDEQMKHNFFRFCCKPRK